MGVEAPNIVEGNLYFLQDDTWKMLGPIQDCTVTTAVQDFVTREEVEEIVERILTRKFLEEDSLIYDLEKRIKEVNRYVNGAF